uniref:Transposase n=1 Tax=Loa loa TaxID=7209 RepID=A0A1I7VXA1_LOALO
MLKQLYRLQANNAREIYNNRAYRQQQYDLCWDVEIREQKFSILCGTSHFFKRFLLRLCGDLVPLGPANHRGRETMVRQHLMC